MPDLKMPFLPRDFAACTNQVCPVRESCWRSRPSPDEKHQTWAYFISHDDGCEERLDPPKRLN